MKLKAPSPHVGDIGILMLKEILRQAGISEDEWNNTRIRSTCQIKFKD
ncbi:toxin-antitoxin system, toxin component, HicA domain protein [Acetomicrobium hydrogeniformans ATCC BAA-1850]|uniref:Toxin-antitoxin system, toxin component, HicA domain protein n=1 Tax=Acetomicrobium hydrogeniformans ATCC BAA-1850 TaxID=592015 RepID=A0A0T5X7T3_9BACT|nr:toxin-antitoxin system, toxin component, HicA domain protein [Acetomicrobium hydrogeniformans ATCC BAA-1850]